MYVGIARLEYRIAEAHSLKAKRHVVRKLLDRILAHFRVSAGEVDHLDKWQRAALGVAVLGADPAHVERMLQKIVQYADDQHLAEPMSRTSEVIRFVGRSGDIPLPGALDDVEAIYPEPGFEDWQGLDGLDSLGPAASRPRPFGDDHE